MSLIFLKYWFKSVREYLVNYLKFRNLKRKILFFQIQAKNSQCNFIILKLKGQYFKYFNTLRKNFEEIKKCKF
jgi:hypothetical protein